MIGKLALATISMMATEKRLIILPEMALLDGVEVATLSTTVDSVLDASTDDGSVSSDMGGEAGDGSKSVVVVP